MNIPFEKLIREALEVPPGADGLCFLPYLAGERSPYWNDSLRGGWYGLKLGHDRRHLVRAVMEGVAFSLRHLLDIYAELGVQIREIALAGGGTRTAGWPQIFADVCGRPVVVYAGQETVTRVLYALCASHLGWGQFEPALESTFGAAEHYLPNEAWYSLYEKLYQTYLRLSEFAHIHAEGTRVS